MTDLEIVELAARRAHAHLQRLANDTPHADFKLATGCASAAFLSFATQLHLIVKDREE